MLNHRNRHSIACIVGAALLGGCDKTVASESRTSSTRDSAGVTIVTSSAPAWTEATAWRVDSTPTFDVGGSETDSARQFWNVKGMHRISKGGVAVLDVGSASIRFFDSLGTPIGRVGRRGRGPGELDPALISQGAINRSAACAADSIYVPVFGRVLVYAAPGKYVREFNLPPKQYPRGCRGNRIVVSQGVSTWPTTAGSHPDTLALSWADLDGKPGQPIATLQSWDRQFGEAGAEGRGYIPPPWGRRLVVAVGDHGLATGDGGRFEVTYYDNKGRIRRLARVDTSAFPLRPVTPADIDRFKSFVKSTGISFGQDFSNQWTRETIRPTAPAFADMVIDTDDNVWLREHDWADVVQFWDFGRSPGGGMYRKVRMETRAWNVLDGEGRLLGRVTFPPRFEVAEIGSDWALGVWRDEDDVEHVRIYRIVKPR